MFPLMIMQFTFDIQKTIAAVAFLMKKEGGRLDMFLTLKMLYLADKNALVKWGKPITGDSFVSMDKGPVISTTYNLFKGKEPEYQEMWDAVFTKSPDYSVYQIGEADTGMLSEREMETLEAARVQINEIPPYQVAKWLHKNCPEWQDPHGTSLPIDPRTILENAGMNQEQIRQIEQSNRYYSSAKKMVGGR